MFGREFKGCIAWL